MPRVSICCSVLNQSEFLKDMITNIREQVFQDWELVLVDDGSTEDIASLVAEFKDERIKLHRFDENKGVPHGINWALEHATGEYVQPLSTDERLEPNKLLWQVGYLDDNPKVDGLWGLPQNGLLGQRPEWEQYALKAHNRSNEAWIRTLLRLEAVPIGGASMLWRASVLKSVGLFDPQFYTTSDLEWFVRFFEKGHKGVILPYRWAYCVDNPKALSKNVTTQDFARDMENVRKHHPLKPPKVMSKVTVAIPVRNMGKYIAETLRSVLGQTWEHFQVIVLDDASTDDTVDVVRRFNDPRITLYQIETNIGANAAQNQMLAMCDTPFFVVLAADDTIEPTFLERLIGEFVRDPWLEFVATQTDFIDMDGKPYIADHPFKTIIKASNKARDQWLAHLYYGNNYFGAGMYRTQPIKDLGGWDTEVGCLGDYEMYLKLLQRENIHVIEENLVHTRIHESNSSILKTKEQQVKLRWDYKKIRDRYYQPRIKVILATPFYEMKGWSPYIVSMCNTIKILTMMGIEHEYWELSGDSYVERAKNTIMTKFLEDPDATDLFMIDSDMQWDAAAVAKLLHFPEEVVVGSYPQKNAWGKWTSLPVVKQDGDKTHPVGRVLPDGSALILADYLAGGFMRIKRSALEKFRDHFKDLRYHDVSADPSTPDREYICFSECITKGGLRWGEDRIFGQRLKEVGVQVFIYPNINFGHYGVKGWLGNFDTFLRNPQTQEAYANQPNAQRMS